MPLETNTVVQQDLAKTIAQEKEVYVCRTDQGQVTSVSDLETFVELVEQDTGTGVRPVARRVETALCRKDFVAGTVSCSTKAIALNAQIPNPLVGCQQSPAQILDPVEMNSVVLPHFVKTIKVEKELFQCRPSPTAAAAGELFLFTEILGGASGDRGDARPGHEAVRRGLLLEGHDSARRDRVHSGHDRQHAVNGETTREGRSLGGPSGRLTPARPRRPTRRRRLVEPSRRPPARVQTARKGRTGSSAGAPTATPASVRACGASPASYPLVGR